MFNGCFSGKIRPCDIDGVVERNSQFLFLEAKPPRGHLSGGQAILLKRLSALPGCTVLIMYGKPQLPERMQIMEAGQVGQPQDCDLETVRLYVKTWFRKADAVARGRG